MMQISLPETCDEYHHLSPDLHSTTHIYYHHHLILKPDVFQSMQMCQLFQIVLNFVLGLLRNINSLFLPEMSKLSVYNYKLQQNMSDYEINIEGLRPNRIYEDISSPKSYKKYMTTTQRSKSKQKLIITSFSKRNNTDKPAQKSQQKCFRTGRTQKVAADSTNNKKSYCQSEYYIKTAETKNQFSVPQLQDQVRVKEGQLEILADRLAKAQYLLKQLTEENLIKTRRIESLEKELGSLLAASLKHLETQQIGADLVFQCQKYKQDQKRLLKMLQNTTQYLYFSKFAELDDGIQFLRHPNQIKKSQLDANSIKKNVHFCTCNKELIPEATFWVPEKIYKIGKEFIKQRKGELTMSQFQLLLYQLNRQWRERQKRIINTLNGEKARQLDKLKRKYSLYKSPQKIPIIK